MKAREFYEVKPLPVPPPRERAKCPQCKKPLKVTINRGPRPVKYGKVMGKPETWYYSSDGHFCTMTCATAFANAVMDNQRHGL